MKIRRMIPDNIPEELTSYNQWVTWKAVEKRNGKTDKIPITPVAGSNAKTNDPETWVTFDQAIDYYKKHKDNGIAGVGFVLAESDPFCGIDLDDCRNPETNEYTEKAIEILTSFNTYSEISPSNTGVKLILKGKLPGKGAAKDGVEIYDQGRFFTITGGWLGSINKRPLDGAINARQKELSELYKQVAGDNQKPDGQNAKGWQDELLKGVSQGGRHQTALRLAGRLAEKGLSDSEIIHFIISWNQSNKPPKPELAGPSKEIQGIVDYVRGKHTLSEVESQDETLSFPDVMSGVAGEFASLHSIHLEAPSHFFYISFLACLGSILSDRLTLNSEIQPQPRLYVLLLGESADVRKSTAIDKVVDFFRNSVDQFGICRGVGSAEGLQKRLEKDRCLLLCLDEFKQFIGKCKIEASVLLPCVNTLFESNYYESWTKKSEIALADVHLSILAASTVQTYERTWDSSFTDIGFNNRLFLVPGSGEKRFSFPSKVPDTEIQYLKQRLQEILSHVGQGLELELTEEAKELYDAWYMNIEDSIHAKRLDTYALRLMALLAVNDLKDEVDSNVVKKVISLSNWQLEVRQIHDPIDSDSAIGKMEEKIRRTLKRNPRTERELKQYTNARKGSMWIYENAKSNLQKSHEIKWIKDKKTWQLIGM